MVVGSFDISRVEKLKSHGQFLMTGSGKTGRKKTCGTGYSNEIMARNTPKELNYL